MSMGFPLLINVSKGAKNRNRYNQVPHLSKDTNIFLNITGNPLIILYQIFKFEAPSCNSF